MKHVHNPEKRTRLDFSLKPRWQSRDLGVLLVTTPVPCTQGEYSEAERLYWRAQDSFDNSLGRGHPSAVVVRGNRAKNRMELVRARARGVVLAGGSADNRRGSFKARVRGVVLASLSSFSQVCLHLHGLVEGTGDFNVFPGHLS